MWSFYFELIIWWLVFIACGLFQDSTWQKKDYFWSYLLCFIWAQSYNSYMPYGSSHYLKRLGKSIHCFHSLMYFSRLRNIGRGYRNIHLMRKMGWLTISSFDMGILPNTFTAIKLFPNLQWLMRKRCLFTAAKFYRWQNK